MRQGRAHGRLLASLDKEKWAMLLAGRGFD
jgi:hypothetical protein